MISANAKTSSEDAPQKFDWPLAYEAEELIRQHIAAFLRKNSFAAQLAARMQGETATDFFEWIDYLTVSPDDETAFRKTGFTEESVEAPGGEVVLNHPKATLPRVILRNGQAPLTIALRPEFVADFIAALNLTVSIEGEPYSRYRRAVLNEENDTRLEAVERSGYRGFAVAPHQPGELCNIIKARELWTTRCRRFEDDAEGFRVANKILDESLSLVGRERSCQYFFESERRYWELRNRAGRTQKHRQDVLGLGWGNHDHHTFRSSREHFADLVEFLQRIGLEKRERFYAGAEAGWGAQVMEHFISGITVFADVDLQPEETDVDFSSKRLPAATRLGTVGLWVGLHGESFLEAGMHHLEARFDFNLLRDQLKGSGINTMNPFSDFQFLRQAFTEGERWQVPRSRAERLLRSKLISQEQFDKFTREGAIGSHLENLQRRGGFKGFNQKAVSVIIAGTDPRKQHFAHATT